MFETLAQEGVNITMISTSEIKISVVVAETYLILAARTLNQALELHKHPLIHDRHIPLLTTIHHPSQPPPAPPM
ncbi:ACT domain-containing protein, partial [Alcanivorax sp. 24]|uniref:ACT domain-containing protein n=1 Tax=Alcanivorax sp. 24 TaxID=2545266 RepID=UPI00351A21B7